MTAPPRYWLVETRTASYVTTRRITARDLPTAYTVAAQLRARTVRHGYRTLPQPTTAIRITELEGTPGSGRVVACLTLPGAPTVAEAKEAAEAAEWRAIPVGAAHRGACLPMPRYRPRLFR